MSPQNQDRHPDLDLLYSDETIIIKFVLLSYNIIMTIILWHKLPTIPTHTYYRHTSFVGMRGYC